MVKRKSKKYFWILLLLFTAVALIIWLCTERGVNDEGYGSFQFADLAGLYPEALDVQIIEYEGFTIAYNEDHEQAEWVCYLLTKDKLESPVCKRMDNFRPDTNIHYGSADLSDYKHSGYDRGHLAPAGDMKWSKQAMSESFLLSNMSPQVPAFNRGVWKKLEEKVRDIVLEEDSIVVVTGPVLSNGLKKIGENDVSVPEFYYKIVFDISGTDQGMLAVLLENKKTSAQLSSSIINIDELEQFTGIDFFPEIADELQDKMESECSESLVQYFVK